MTDNFFTRLKERALKSEWGKGAYILPGGGGCLAGLMGVRNVDARYAMTQQDRDDSVRATAFTVRCLNMSIEEWNDREHRTFDDVLALLDKLAEAWEDEPQVVRMSDMADFTAATTFKITMVTVPAFTAFPKELVDA